MKFGNLVRVLVVGVVLMAGAAQAFQPVITQHINVVNLSANPTVGAPGSFQRTVIPVTGMTALIGWSGYGDLNPNDSVYAIFILRNPGSRGVIAVEELYYDRPLPLVLLPSGRGFALTQADPPTFTVYCVGPIGNNCAFDFKFYLTAEP